MNRELSLLVMWLSRTIKTEGNIQSVKLLKNRQGFTLVELMVATAILGILMVGFMQFMSFQGRSLKTTELKGELLVAKDLFTSYWKSKSICEATLGGRRAISEVPITKILSQIEPEKVELDLGKQIPNTNWKVTDMALLSNAQAQAVDSAITGTVDSDGVTTVVVKVTLQQARGDTVVSASENRNNYAGLTKDLYFNIRVKMAEMFLQTSSTLTDKPDLNYFTTTTGMGNCNWAGVQPPGTGYTTNGAYLAAVYPGIQQSNVVFKEDPKNEYVVPVGTFYSHEAPCWAYSADMAIDECVTQ